MRRDVGEGLNGASAFCFGGMLVVFQNHARINVPHNIRDGIYIGIVIQGIGCEGVA
jgi:hypothetical protein